MLCTKSLNLSPGLFKRFKILPLPCGYVFSLMNFTVNNQEKSKQNPSIHTWINTIFIDQLPNFHVSTKVNDILASDDSIVNLAVLKPDEGNGSI
jgi:hypothetical protein